MNEIERKDLYICTGMVIAMMAFGNNQRILAGVFLIGITLFMKESK